MYKLFDRRIETGADDCALCIRMTNNSNNNYTVPARIICTLYM